MLGHLSTVGDRPFRTRVALALAVVAALHLAGLALLVGGLGAAAGGLTVGLAGVAYLRGLAHAFDFDHVSMIDNSTRKFVAEGREPASVGLAFSAGHCTVVLATGALVIGGAGAVRTALRADSAAGQALGAVGLAVAGVYLLLLAAANLAAFGQAWRLRALLRRDPDAPVSPGALTPRGPAARLLTAPLRRVRHPRHIYLLGMLFSLGFDTSSQVGVMILAAGAALSGAPPLCLLSLPLLFAAGMTLGDTVNGVLMVRLYRTAQAEPRRLVGYNLVITGVGIASGLIVGATAAATLLVDHAGVRDGGLRAVASLDRSWFGYLLAALLLVIGAAGWLWRRRSAAPLGAATAESPASP